MGRAIVFASSSVWKRAQVRDFLARHGIAMLEPPVQRAAYGLDLQAEQLEIVCEHKARTAAAELGCAVVVDDTGFFVDALNGFPGPYVKYVNETVGPAGLLALMRDVPVRTARIASCVGYCEPGGAARLFSNEMAGRVAKAPASLSGNDWADLLFFPVFVPHGHVATLAQMRPEDVIALPEYPLRRGIERFAAWFACGDQERPT